VDFLRGFHLDRKQIGVVISIILAISLWFMPLPGDLSLAGRKMLVVTLFTAAGVG
jgi:hypothetical protein